MSGGPSAKLKRHVKAEAQRQPERVASRRLSDPSAISPDLDWRVFSPILDDSGTAYAELSRAVSAPQGICEALRAIAHKAAQADSGIDALRTRASALVLHDLVAMGWGVRVLDHFIEVRPPVGSDQDTKDAIRRQLQFGRDDQLREPATRRFIMGLERPSRLSNLRPVTELIADGRRLATRLEGIAKLPRNERAEALAGVCQPYIQLVDADAIDNHTGLRLMDIWRYFRHSWATRYRSSPGRNLFYLIRDAAQPNHPVMGITALGNTVMQLACRDHMLGWTPEGLVNLIDRGEFTDREVINAFRQRLKADLSQIYTDDLPVPKNLSRPISSETLDELRIIEAQAADLRTKKLRDVDDDEAVPPRVDAPKTADLEALARTPLFRTKRARTVRDILRAMEALRGAKSIASLLTHEEGAWAVSQVIRQLKKQFSATAMMEITVCGAIPPYNHLLGGKLACLMMLSPRIVRDYSERYANDASIIASQMAGRPVIKTPSLVFLGTSSLYTHHSSQYNRVRLPATTLAGQPHDVSYVELGISQGYGSPNLSAETESALEQLSMQTRSYRNVNFLFGEGQSPKMRRLRESFDALGLRRANILHHAANRIIYGVPLASNCARFLLGVDETPSYALPESPDADECIAHFWLSRWLASRLDFAPALAAVAQSSPLSNRVSRLIPSEPHPLQFDLFDAPVPSKERHMLEPAKDDERIAFLRNLYRNESAYSDEVQIGRLRELNVKTPLDSVIRNIVRAGGSVIITGNAGDGKTHTIRLLERVLTDANAYVIPDASELSLEEVLDAWVKARDESRPFCIAINEGLLVDLIRAHRDQHPWLEEIRQDLLGLMRYVPVEETVEDTFHPEPGKTVIVDLSLRRTLSPELLRRIINKLIEDKWYAGCAPCAASKTCPVSYNRKMLAEKQVQDRLIDLLSRVAERGVRATFREVLAYVSYIIFGNRTCAELAAEANSEQTRYFWNAFEGQGSIFECLARGLDPLRQTSPKVDEALWNGILEPGAFLGHGVIPLTSRNFDAMDTIESAVATAGFTALKRRWYFEHREGCLTMQSAADATFHELQDQKATPQLRAGRLVALLNAWWNPKDRNQQDRLRLWTRLSFSPRAQGRAMVSGRDVSSLKLTLFRPVLAPALRAAFGDTVIDHLLFGPPPAENLKYVSLVIDRRLMEVILAHGLSEKNRAIERQLSQFNDALSRFAEGGSHVRTVELFDPSTDLDVKVRVDLTQRRYDSAQ